MSVSLSTENMMHVSYILFSISGAVLAAAVVIFFALDIPRCWRMVSGNHFVHKKRKTETGRTAAADRPLTEKMRRSPEKITGKPSVFTESEETVLLQNEPKTVLLDHEDAISEKRINKTTK